ncbi:MAG: hypothetical protein H7178_06890 [Chitinophagaceae bacterium]|nr:hypothetical protein [Chitinophagaceae bacterium]
MSKVIDELLNLSLKEKVNAYKLLKEDIENRNALDADDFSEEDLVEMEARLSDLGKGRVKALSLEEHLSFVNGFGKHV